MTVRDESIVRHSIDKLVSVHSADKDYFEMNKQTDREIRDIGEKIGE